MKLRKMFLMLAMVSACTVTAFATPEDGKPAVVKPDPQNPVKKLARGVVNVVIGVGEIPINIGDVEEREGVLQAVYYGSLKGICFFVLREVVGVVDIGTFYMPLPATVENGKRSWSSWSYGPLMMPEWVIE